MSAPSISVIIAAYRAAATLPATIRSVQTHSGYVPIIVVVDGACAATEAAAKAFADIRIICNPDKQGAPYSRNRGLELVTTRYVTFLDADDYIEGPLHQGMVDHLYQCDADIVFSAWQVETQGKRGPALLASRLAPALMDANALLELWVRGFSVGTGAVGWKTSALRSIGGWDPDISKAQDFEVGARSIMAGLKPALNPHGRLIYVNHPVAGRVSRQSIISTLASHASILEKIVEHGRSHQHQGVLNAAGQRYYQLASALYWESQTEAGNQLLAKARKLGFRGHAGSSLHRLACQLLGLRWKQTVSRFLYDMKRRWPPTEHAQ